MALESLELDLARGGPGLLQLYEDRLVLETKRLLESPWVVDRSEIVAITWWSDSGAGFRAELCPSATQDHVEDGLLFRPRWLRSPNISVLFRSPVLLPVSSAYRYTGPWEMVGGLVRPAIVSFGGERLRVGQPIAPQWIKFRTRGESLDAKVALERWGVAFPEFANVH